VTFAEARAQFPVFGRYAYLNAGTNGPLATATVAAMEAWHRQDLEHGRFGKAYFDQILELRERVRRALADVLAVAAEDVALVSSTTNACNIVVAGLDLGADDEIVTTDSEHFGLLGPVLAARAQVRVANVLHADAADAAQLILEQITPRTRLIAISHVSWMTGNSLLPDEVRRETELPILVDGAQSVGAVEVAARAFDFYTVSGQKWLCGPDSTGALYVREPERLRVALPTYMSQLSYDLESFAPKPGAQRFDSVWLPPATLAGLLAALEAAPRWRHERTLEMASFCRARLGQAGYDIVTTSGQGGLMSFSPRDDAEAAVARLFEAGVIVRNVPTTDWLRVSCGWWTSEEDVERLVAAL
jgi:L-cysteine/cystine lyase